MKLFRLLRPHFLPFAIVLLSCSAANVLAQQTLPTGVNSSSVLTQLATASLGGQVIQQIHVFGTATWSVGGLLDSGTANLTASTNGSSQMQLVLASTGVRTETQSGAGSSADCQWAGADGVAHEVSVGNCWKPAVWFFPALSLQPSLLPSYLGVIDLGLGSVGSSANTYRHLESQLTFAGLPSTLTASITQQSITDLGLDPSSLLPAILAYSVLPDNGVQTPIAIEIHYSNYQAVNGVQIPFLIQRYVNGSLQLAIVVNSAQIS